VYASVREVKAFSAFRSLVLFMFNSGGDGGGGDDGGVKKWSTFIFV
jgi:hypothetical protein